ncbi:hypothetical protein GCM10010116_43770 [Microbispora rosea subsp. aerata]|nr:hypothetical protein [Microbispora rosea]GGO21746.1 hypothetical protein GCM10010116_43770 [Microbispora rosea subsp. aerata]GIH53771.1 hypothetical protein Mro02_06850 [Microbispora rosea subsp. aerata]GLJ81765.1 hypothetical protein GCM10017588_04900 [Microbispora rosea subsp. aerata]
MLRETVSDPALHGRQPAPLEQPQQARGGVAVKVVTAVGVTPADTTAARMTLAKTAAPADATPADAAIPGLATRAGVTPAKVAYAEVATAGDVAGLAPPADVTLTEAAHARVATAGGVAVLAEVTSAETATAGGVSGVVVIGRVAVRGVTGVHRPPASPARAGPAGLNAFIHLAVSSAGLSTGKASSARADREIA